MGVLRVLSAGESHGVACVAIIEGMPAGLSVGIEDINKDLKKRQTDFGRGGRGAIEADEAEILSGVRHGRTMGSPITLMVKNRDSANWAETMRVEASTGQVEKLTRPRPGHADLAGAIKYGHDDIRDTLERASARETVGRVMAGALVRRLLVEFGIRLASHTVQIGEVRLERTPRDFGEVAAVYERDPDIRCIDPEASLKMKAVIQAARERGDTVGGVVEVIATGAPVGLGSVMHYDRRLDGQMAGALMSIPSVKAVEIGDAIAGTAMPGSEFQDVIGYQENRYIRETNHLGGIEGGISNGADIVCRVYHKPIATLVRPSLTVDIETYEAAEAIAERSDVCVVPRAGVVAEAMLAIVLGQAMLDKFGGDHLDEMKRNFRAYIESLR